MTYNKWPSPHGHAIASDKTDKLPQPEAAKVALDALNKIQAMLLLARATINQSTLDETSDMDALFQPIRAALQTPASDGVLDTWTLPYKSSDSDERIRKVIKTLALPENSTVVWGALKQLENEIRFALVADYNALKQSTAKD